MLVLDALTKRFGETTAVAELSLDVARGEFVTLLGPSGCGKTTTLRMVAGFEAPTSGRIFLGGRDVTALPPQRRGVGLVFQNYALFPHLDVFENIAFGLRARRQPGSEIAMRVQRALERVDLAGYARRKVQELSGGEQQRVALARALAPEPPVLLLDEPLSNLDAALRERTRVELRTLLKHLGITAVFVTHDQEEAFALSDRIAVLNRGVLQQVGTPETLYDAPANAFVASFLGRANFLEAEVVEVDGDSLVCRLAGGDTVWRARAPSGNGPRAGGPAAAVAGSGAGASGPGRGDAVRLMIRPEGLAIGPGARRLRGARSGGREPEGEAGSGPTAGELFGTVVDRRFAGASTLYRVQCSQADVLVLGRTGDAEPGEPVRLLPRPGAAIRAFPRASPAPVPTSD